MVVWSEFLIHLDMSMHHSIRKIDCLWNFFSVFIKVIKSDADIGFVKGKISLYDHIPAWVRAPGGFLISGTGPLTKLGQWKSDNGPLFSCRVPPPFLP